MVISKKDRYLICALRYLAVQYPSYCNVQQIAEYEKLPIFYLSQILSKLVGKELVESRKGRSGGFKLSKNPSEYTLMEILVALGDTQDLGRCFLCVENRDKCAHCPYWKFFESINRAVDEMLQTTTLEDLKKIDRIAELEHCHVREA